MKKGREGESERGRERETERERERGVKFTSLITLMYKICKGGYPGTSPQKCESSSGILFTYTCTCTVLVYKFNAKTHNLMHKWSKNKVHVHTQDKISHQKTLPRKGIFIHSICSHVVLIGCNLLNEYCSPCTRQQ